MLRQTGLLIVSNPTQIGKLLSRIQKQVKNTLYIQLLSSLSEPFGNFYPKTFNTWPKLSKTIFNIYSQAATHCYDLDVKVLLSGIKYNIPNIKTQKPIDLIIFDKLQNQSEIENFIKTRVQNVTKEYDVVFLDDGNSEYDSQSAEVENVDNTICSHTVLGGTFDRLHLAHKLLLSEAALRSSEKVTVGVTEENMLKSKFLWELIEDIDVRIHNVASFLNDICPELKLDVVPISDPFGPAVVNQTMELIVVSQETIRGGQKINEIRKEKNLRLLTIVPIELVDEPNPRPIEEAKISSSTKRIRLLGSVLKPIEPNDSIPKSPYVIGLTGGIASGKSGVAGHLENLGAHVINCDVLGHQVYQPGKPCHKKIVEHFGERVVSENGEINRQVLGGIVFADSAEMSKLNTIVWPAIAEEVRNIIRTTDKTVVVVEAAVLLIAGWQTQCHEVWTTLVPREEAIRRLIERNKLTEEQAKHRIDSQPANTYYVQKSHVVFCPFWEIEYTREQVVRAWDTLQQRLEP